MKQCLPAERMTLRLGSSLKGSSRSVQLLAALLYADPRIAVSKVKIPFAWLFRIAMRKPSLQEVSAASCGAPPGVWPMAAGSTRALAPLLDVLRDAIALSRSLRITDGETVIRSVAFVLQTSATLNAALREENEEILQRSLPEARRATHGEVPVAVASIAEPEAVRRAFACADRVDESPGGYCVTATGELTAWFAAHVGPRRANIRENQDAAWAEVAGDRVVFAIADGVSTSFGSRFAAWTSVRAAVRYLAEQAGAEPSAFADAGEVLRRAAECAQHVVGDCLLHALAHGDEDTWATIRGRETLPVSSARRLMENTLSRAMPSLGPAFATTLVVGVVDPPVARRAGSMVIMRIGDGAAEVAAHDRSVRSLFAVDNVETVISSALCPGVIGSDSVSRAEVVVTQVGHGDQLLVSTDGLTRGHARSVTDVLRRELTPAIFESLDKTAALTVLAAAASAADRLPPTDDSGLFEDNLSLIRISVRGR
ncbi:MAG TPA: protein phosphatase 2C domain-containing protein [Thermoanaerobaculia bacterium]|nr:protein phosphatase 2C domain-containing protein [Thermoanaerobaculia bacterium]